MYHESVRSEVQPLLKQLSCLSGLYWVTVTSAFVHAGRGKNQCPELAECLMLKVTRKITFAPILLTQKEHSLQNTLEILKNVISMWPCTQEEGESDIQDC